MKDFHISGSRLLLYTGEDETVRVPDGVTEICSGAFAGRHRIKEIYLPDSVTTIGFCAFASCLALQKVHFSAALETIETFAFSCCIALREVCLPDTLRYMGDVVFSGCNKLRRAVCTGTPRFAGNPFFDPVRRECNAGLYDRQGFLIFAGALFDYRGTDEEIVVPEGVRAVAASAFQNYWGKKTTLRSVFLPDSLREIGASAFDGNKELTRLRLPAGVKIAPDAFCGCTGLAYETGYFIYEGTLYGYNKRSEAESMVPPHATADTAEVFTRVYTQRLEAEPKIPPQVTAVAAEVFTKKIVHSIVLPEGIRTICSSAFKNCHLLESAVLPDSLREIGEDAFTGCNKLRTLRLPPHTTIGKNAFRGCRSLQSENGFCIVNNELFAYDGKNESVTVPPNVTAIHDGVFSGSAICEIRLPAGLRRLGCAFEGCRFLRSVEIPEGVEAIEPAAFRECESLESVRLPHNLKRIGADAFRLCTSLKDCTIPEGVTEIGKSVFFSCVSLQSIVLPDTLREVPAETFWDCAALRQVRFPKKLQTIGKDAFRGCKALESAPLPNGLAKIGASAFYGCASLKSLSLPESLVCIGANAFKGCTSLQTIDVKRVCAHIEENAFPADVFPEETGPFLMLGDRLMHYTGAENKVTVPAGVRMIETEAFKGSPAEELTLPDSVRELGRRALAGAAELRSILLPAGLRKIGLQAFSGCKSLRSVRLPAELSKLAPEAFHNCCKLETIEVSAGNEFFTSVDGVLYDAAGKTLLQYPPAKKATAFTVPDGVVTIAADALYNLSLREITLPASVQNIGEKAFNGRELRRITVAEGAGRGSIADDVFDLNDDGTPPKDKEKILLEPQIPLFLVKNPHTRLRLALGYVLQTERYAYEQQYRAYAETHRKMIFRAAGTVLPNVEAYYGMRKNGVPLPGAAVDYGKLSEQAKVELLEEYALKRDAAAVRRIAAGCGRFAFLPRALGLACKYGDAQTVRVLIEAGADFRYAQGSRQSGKYGAYKQNGYMLHPANYDLLLADTGAAQDPCVHFGRLPETDAAPNTDTERLAILEYLAGLPEKGGINLPRLLYYAVLWGHAPVAAWLISHGVSLRPQADTPPVYETEVQDLTEILTTADRNWQRTEFINVFYTQAPETLIRTVTVFADLLTAEGKKMLLTDTVFIRTHKSELLFAGPNGSYNKYTDVNENILDPRLFRLLLQRAELYHVNKMQLMNEAVKRNNAALLYEMVCAGWLRDTAAVNTLTELAIRLNATETLMLLLKHKNDMAGAARTALTATEKLLQGLGPANSAARLKSEWCWRKQEKGTLEIYAYKGSKEKVTVPDAIGNTKVSKIGCGAFSANGARSDLCACRAAVTEVDIPEGISEIGERAFEYCTGLMRVSIPASVKSIGAGAFRNCTRLSDVRFAGPIPDMPSDVFRDCTALMTDGTVVINGVLLLIEGARGIYSLPDGITEIGANVLRSDGPRSPYIWNLLLPDSLRVIRDHAFDLQGQNAVGGIDSVLIPEGVQTVGSHAFRGAGLKHLSFCSGVETIGDYAFSFNRITDIRLPASVKSVGSGAFYGCKNLKSVYFCGSDTAVGENLLGDYADAPAKMFVPGGITVYAPPGSSAAEECARYRSVRVLPPDAAPKG